MAAKVFFLLALTVAIVSAESDCNCDSMTESDTKALWSFLTKMSTDLTDYEDREMRAVLPGVLSPLLECNCLEKNRKKRRIISESEEKKDVLRQKKSVHFQTRRCPQGYVWIGIMCAREEYLE